MFRWFKRILLFLLSILLILLLLASVHTYMLPSRQPVLKDTSKIAISDSSLWRLAEAIKIKTVTPAIPETRDSAAFIKFQTFLYQNYPLLHSKLKMHTFKHFALLYKWEGKNKKLQPFLLMAHQDVVPADDSRQWILPPFSGAIQDGYMYGRGTLDIKSGILGIMEAVEMLLKEGYEPERTLYLAFGYDEESGKGIGAASIATFLKSQGVRLQYVLDEGGLILKKALPGLETPVALVGIAEKGFVNLKIVAKGEGGHSSMPAKETAVTRLAAAICKLNKHPFEAKIEGSIKQLFSYAGPEMKFPFNVIFTNKWLFAPIIISQMTKIPSGNAAIRTTTAFTMLQGSSKENVIPSEAVATANVRLMPGMEIQAVKKRMEGIIGDSAVAVEILQPNQPASKVSSAEAPGFKIIQNAVAHVFPNVITAPFLLVAFTDSRKFSGIADAIYRFHPAIYEKSDLERLHGKNERIATENYKDIIRFYRKVILFSNLGK